MTRSAVLSLLALFLSALGLLMALNACGTGNLRIPSGKIHHVVVIVQENRTPDNLFHDPVLISRGADIASSGMSSSGTRVPLQPVPLGVDYDLSHAHQAFVTMYDHGRMDGADKIPIVCGITCPDPKAAFRYVQPSDVGPYFQIAEQYTFGDRMFQTNQGPSFPAHQFLISGTSAPTETSHWFAAENTNDLFLGGCNAPPQTLTLLIDPNGRESVATYPCFEHRTLTDEMDAVGLPWRYYAPSASHIWTAPNAIRHMCQPEIQNGQPVCTGEAWKNVIIPPKIFLTDMGKNHLAAVTWVVPIGQASDHPGSAHTNGGPSWVAAVVNAVGNSAFWSDTAIIVTWDDWGGWYDHVPPPKVINDGKSWGSGYVYGFRVPLIVVSPFAKPAHISHVNHDFGSILKFIEEVFSLGTLGYADGRADNLADCFNFSQRPLKFKTIDAPLKADYFINDTRVPENPDTD
jgi:phospholipase C